jgi:hypothetical protein
VSAQVMLSFSDGERSLTVRAWACDEDAITASAQATMAQWREWTMHRGYDNVVSRTTVTLLNTGWQA